LDGVLEVDEEGEIGDSAVVVAFFAEDFEARAGEGGFFEGLGGSYLWLGYL